MRLRGGGCSNIDDLGFWIGAVWAHSRSRDGGGAHGARPTRSMRQPFSTAGCPTPTPRPPAARPLGTPITSPPRKLPEVPPTSHARRSVLESWVKGKVEKERWKPKGNRKETMRDAVRNKERWKRCRTPTQDPINSTDLAPWRRTPLPT